MEKERFFSGVESYCVTIIIILGLGIVGMFLYPVIVGVLHLSGLHQFSDNIIMEACAAAVLFNTFIMFILGLFCSNIKSTIYRTLAKVGCFGAAAFTFIGTLTEVVPVNAIVAIVLSVISILALGAIFYLKSIEE